MSTQLEAAIRQALIDNGIGPTGGGMHSWRCEYPDRYGPCDCFAETVADLLDAIKRTTHDTEQETS